MVTNHRFHPFHRLMVKQKPLEKSYFSSLPKVFFSKVKKRGMPKRPISLLIGKKVSWNCLTFMILLLSQMKCRAIMEFNCCRLFLQKISLCPHEKQNQSWPKLVNTRIKILLTEAFQSLPRSGGWRSISVLFTARWWPTYPTERRWQHNPPAKSPLPQPDSF